MSDLRALLESQPFQIGVVFGVATAVFVVAYAGLASSIRPRRRGLLGCAWAIGSLLAVAGWFGVPRALDVRWYLPVGLVVLGLGAEVGTRYDHHSRLWLARFVCLVPGAAILGYATRLTHPWWLTWVVVLGVVCSPLVADLDRRSERIGLAPVMWLITLAGLYAYLPENDAIRAMIGVAVPLALIGIPLRMARLGDGGSSVAVGLMFWVVAEEANGLKIQSWITIFMLGLLLLEPIGYRFLWSRIGRVVTTSRDVGPWNIRNRVRRLRGLGGSTPTIAFQLTTLVVHTACVLYVALVVGPSERYSGDTAKPMVLLIPVVIAGILYGVVAGITPRLRYVKLRRDARGSRVRSSARRSVGSTA